MLSARPPGVHLDLKKSSYKKLSKFLSRYDKEGLISAKEDKHTKEHKVSSLQCPLHAFGV